MHSISDHIEGMGRSSWLSRSSEPARSSFAARICPAVARRHRAGILSNSRDSDFTSATKKPSTRRFWRKSRPAVEGDHCGAGLRIPIIPFHGRHSYA